MGRLFCAALLATLLGSCGDDLYPSELDLQDVLFIDGDPMSLELNTPYTLTVTFSPPLSSIGQFRALTPIFGNHLFVLTSMNPAGATVLTMFTTAKAAKAASVGKTAFEFGSTRAVIAAVTKGTTVQP